MYRAGWFRVSKTAFFIIATGFFVSLCSCGGGGGSTTPTPTPTPSVTIVWSAPPPSTLSIGVFTSFEAVVNNTSNAQVTWTVTCGSQGVCGTFGQSTIDLVDFTAPSTVPNGKTIAITATSVADPTKSISATITITANIAFYGIPPASLQVGRAAQVAALVGGNADINAQVNWAVSCGAADCGSLGSSVTLNHFPVTYTAPSTLPTGMTVKLTAMSADDPTQSVSDKIVITPLAQNLADGTYVFQLANGSSVIYTGSFTGAGGTVLSGEMDTASQLSESSFGNPVTTYQTLAITGGTYSTTPDGNLRINLETQGDTSAVFTGVLAADGQSLVAEIFGTGYSGTLERQTSIAAPTGSFVFGLTEYSWSSIAGVLNIDSPGGISGQGSEFDWLTNINYPNQKLNASTVSAPDAFGRVVFKLNPTSTSPTSSIHLVGYMADATHIRLDETGGDTLTNMLYGYAVGQGSSASTFTAASVSGSRFVAAANGLYNNGLEYGGPGQMVAQLNAESGGSLTGNLTWQAMRNGAGTAMPDPITGSWSVDSTGRMTFSLQTAASFTTNCVLYLIGDGSGILLTDTTNNIQFTGQAYARAAGTQAPTALTGNYASVTSILLGSLTSTSSGGTETLSGFTDSLVSENQNVALSGTLTAFADGILSGSFTGLDATSSTAPHTFLVYLVDNQRALAIQIDNNAFTLGYLQRLQ